MKKVLVGLLAVLLAFSMASCALFGSQKIYEKSAKTFSVDGMSITLTSGFTEAEFEGYVVCYDSSEVAIFVIEEEFSLIDGASDWSIEDYADLVRQANLDQNPVVSEDEGLITMKYNYYNADEKTSYSYYSVMFKGPSAFWLVQFACEQNSFEEYKPHFIEWAKSVKFN